jgi:hypothetical protein
MQDGPTTVPSTTDSVSHYQNTRFSQPSFALDLVREPTVITPSEPE